LRSSFHTTDHSRGQGVGIEIKQDKFQTTVPPLLEILFRAATVC
jgi:hypothetical protein